MNITQVLELCAVQREPATLRPFAETNQVAGRPCLDDDETSARADALTHSCCVRFETFPLKQSKVLVLDRYFDCCME
jgi:hypothetical protein